MGDNTEITYQETDDENIVRVQVVRNGVTHSVNVFALTPEQFDNLTCIKKEIENEKNNSNTDSDSKP